MLSEEIDNFEFIVDFNRAGYLRVKSIEIQRNSVWLQVILAVTIFFSLVINIWFFFKRKRKVLVAIGVIILLVSLPLFVKGIHAGHDINFHLMRIEGLADELRRGVFPVKISSLWTDGYGYPVSVFYGDILLYVAAILRMIGFPVVMAYKSYLFLINVGTVIISYICFKRIFNRDNIAVLTTLAYATAGYRIACLYVRAAVGEYSAMMFLPIIALAIYGFYTSDSDNWKVYRQYAIILALGMTGVIGSHILTTEMVVVTLTVVCIIFLRRTFKKYVLYGYALAVIESVAFNLYFLIPFFDYYNNVEVVVSSISDSICAIQEQGAYIGQYFFFFKDIFGQSGSGLASRMSLTPGMSLMSALVIAIAIWMNGRATKEIRILSVLSVFFLFMASDLFPWNHLGLHYKWGRILSQIQFPWRYLGIAIIFLTMLLGSVCKLCMTDRREFEKIFAVILCSCMIMMVFYSSNYSNEAWMINYYDMAEVDTSALVGGEYIRSGTNINSLQGKIAQKNMKEVSLLSRAGTYMELYCEASESEGVIEVPLLNYKGYRVWDEDENEYEIKDGENNVIQFSVPAEFAGKIMIDFFEPWYWRVGELVSLAAVIYVCVWILKEVSMCYFKMNGRDGC